MLIYIKKDLRISTKIKPDHLKHGLEGNSSFFGLSRKKAGEILDRIWRMVYIDIETSATIR